MRWILAFHIIFIISWFAGLFYLPRLFVYHANCADILGNRRFKIMERRLFWGITTPAGLSATAFGIWLFCFNSPIYLSQPWMQWKLLLAGILWLYHFLCGRFVIDFQRNRNAHTAKFYRWFNEIPTVLLLIIVILATVKP